MNWKLSLQITPCNISLTESVTLFCRYVLECVECGVIYRSRQHWFGNEDPVNTVVRTELRHVWPGVSYRWIKQTNKANFRKKKHVVANHGTSFQTHIRGNGRHLNLENSYCLTIYRVYLTRANCRRIILRNASVNYSCAQPPPAGWPPGISFFFALGGKLTGVGTLELSNSPDGGQKKRANAPSSFNTATFFIDRTVA